MAQHHLRTSLLGALLCALLSPVLTASEPQLAFADPTRADALMQHDGYLHIIAFYCANCPTARSRVSGMMKEMHDIIEAEQLPAVIILITPDRDPKYLRTFAQDNNLHGALFAQDQTNALNIGLQNIWQMRPGFKGQRLRPNPTPENLVSYVAKQDTHYRFPVEGLQHERAKELWWMVERGMPEAIATLAEASTRRNPLQEDAKRIREVVEPFYRQREAALVAAEPSMDTIEGLEALLEEAQALGMDDAQQRLRALLRERSLRDELTARQAYQRIHSELLGSNNRRQREQAPAAFAQLAERFPDTTYGRKAAAKK
ncbi:MAG: hypothetical protein EA401_13875 [Planctomycetota bacterium]|nr:MAG: hypothetical protein EA401_13875 [Planctomycetota bacterium]